MTKYFFDSAYEFYHYVIYQPSIQAKRFLPPLQYSLNGTISSKILEALAAILTGDSKCDSQLLDNWNGEVKSAALNNDFVYDYGVGSGILKLEVQQEVCHFYVIYWNDYLNIDVKVVYPQQIKNKLETWRPKIISSNKKHSISLSHSFVSKNGEVVFSIRDGEMVKRKNPALLAI